MKKFALACLAFALVATATTEASAQNRRSPSQFRRAAPAIQDARFRGPSVFTRQGNRTAIVDSGNGEFNRISVSNRGRSRRGNQTSIVGSGNGFGNVISVRNGGGRFRRGAAGNDTSIIDSGNGEGNRISVGSGGRLGRRRGGGGNSTSIVGSGNGSGNRIIVRN